MIEKALRYLIGLSKDDVVEIEGRNYSTVAINPVREPLPRNLCVNTLGSITDYIKSNIDKLPFPVIVHVEGYKSVKVMSALFGPFKQREDFILAMADVPEFRFGQYYDHESFIIAMQSKFVPSDSVRAILSLVGTVQDGLVSTFGDDGVSQTVTAKTGIAKVGDIAVPNPVTLRPFRTFTEVTQPESMFIFRMKSGRETPEMALFEADGGAWKNIAMQNIREYFELSLSKLIADGQVVLIS